ncbi:MAG: hypothetical protein VYC39_06010 [Myxococcota bacterium]|nr:hypothetical protein [Myxococcota bacterium]
MGINEIDKASGNDSITDGRSLPWLQDTEAVAVTSAWQHNLRDVVILNTRNERVAVYGLTENSLGDPSNYETLKQLFLDAANSK